jgi:hypothetical protein
MSAARSPAESWQIFVQARTPSPPQVFFISLCTHQSIKGVLLKWAAWRLAIENSWGGPATDAKEDQLWQSITAYFSTGKEPHWDEVRELACDLFCSFCSMFLLSCSMVPFFFVTSAPACGQHRCVHHRQSKCRD